MIKSVGIIANPNKKKALKYQKDIKGYLSKKRSYFQVLREKLKWGRLR